jgi:hypothetical protein
VKEPRRTLGLAGYLYIWIFWFIEKLFVFYPGGAPSKPLKLAAIGHAH